MICGRTPPLSSSPCTPFRMVTSPFPRTNLSSVNVDGIEIGCHQSPQHEQEANEAGSGNRKQEKLPEAAPTASHGRGQGALEMLTLTHRLPGSRSRCSSGGLSVGS